MICSEQWMRFVVELDPRQNDWLDEGRCCTYRAHDLSSILVMAESDCVQSKRFLTISYLIHYLNNGSDQPIHESVDVSACK